MKLKILGHEYDIESYPHNEIPDDDGKINFLLGKMYIKDSNPGDVQRETVMHEIVEGINWWGDLKLDHHIICLLGTFLWGVLKENPDVVEFLWKQDGKLI